MSKANVKINYWHQYTIEAVQSFTFLRRTTENCKNILNYCFKNVSFALLNEWNVTKTSFDYAWSEMEESCDSCLWAQYISDLSSHLRLDVNRCSLERPLYFNATV